MAKTYSCLLVGVDVHVVEIETALGSGFSGLNILGLGSEATRDMRERVRSALESIGIPIPARRVVVNIGPSNIVKISRTALNQLDFAVAACVIRALFEDKEEKKGLWTPEYEFLAGELSLNGELKQISNPLIYEAIVSFYEKDLSICLPTCSEGKKFPFEYFCNLKSWFEDRKCNGSKKISENKSEQPQQNVPLIESLTDQKIDLAQQTISLLLKNPRICVALLVAAVGGHHILVAGEPGIGKSFALKKFSNFLLPLNQKQRIEVKLINPAADDIHRPFRSPHHSSTSAALVGGSSLRPGEVTLAHHGVLFLDELAEFPRATVEALREPLDSGNMTLSRAGGTILYPARFQLCATANPCPCGYIFSRKKPCRCNPSESRKYLQKISGPLLDRFCLQIWLEPNADGGQLDIFSQYLMKLTSPTDLSEFVKHFFLVQKNRQENKFVPLNQTELQLKNTLSLRGQEKLFQIVQTFQILFPSLTKETGFLEQVMNYRVLNDMFGKKGIL